MEKQDNIVRCTIEEIEEMIARGEARMDDARIDATTEEEIAAQAAEGDAEDFPKGCERPATMMSLPLTKRPINLRVDADVLDWFKRSGKGYQTRMKNVLRAFMKAAERRG
jgi:uncharacterized protein (DUF4415 family)